MMDYEGTLENLRMHASQMLSEANRCVDARLEVIFLRAAYDLWRLRHQMQVEHHMEDKE